MSKHKSLFTQRLAACRAKSAKDVVSTEGIIDKVRSVFSKDKTSYPEKLKIIKANVANITDQQEPTDKTVKVTQAVPPENFYSTLVAELTDYLKYLNGANCNNYLDKIGAVASSVEKANQDAQVVYREFVGAINSQGLKITTSAFPNLKKVGNSYSTQYKLLPNLTAWTDNRPELKDAPTRTIMELPPIQKVAVSKIVGVIEQFMADNAEIVCSVPLQMLDDEVAESFTSPLHRLGDAGVYQGILTNVIDVLYIAASKAAVSTEDGDVNVTIQQENEIETTDDAALVETTDKNVNPDAFDPTQAEADKSDKELDAAISDVDQAADTANKEQMDDIATAVQGLESVKLLVDRTADQRTNVSPLALEAIQLSINLAAGKFAHTATVPSVESMTFGHRDGFQNLSMQLNTLTKDLRAQHTDLKLANYSQESIVGWVGNKWSDMFISMWDSGVYRGIANDLTNTFSLIERRAQEFRGLNAAGAFITDPWTVWHLRGVTANNLDDAMAKIGNVTNEIESFYKDRMVNVEKAAEKAIDGLINGQDFDITIRDFQADLVNLSLYSGRDIKLTGSTMYQGLRRVFGKAFKPGGGRQVDGINTDWSIERGIVVLPAEAIMQICKETRAMIGRIIPILAAEKTRRQNESALIRLKFDEAIKASAASDLKPTIAIAKNLERGKEVLEYVNGIESVMMRAIRDNLYYLTYYLYASLTALEYIRDPYKAVREAEEAARAEAEEERLAMKAEYEEELAALRNKLEASKEPELGDDHPNKPKIKSDDEFYIVITY